MIKSLRPRVRWSSSLFKVPEPFNEPVLSFGPNSVEREQLQKAISRLQQSSVPTIPLVINGQHIFNKDVKDQIGPYDGKVIAKISQATADQVDQAIESSLVARVKWANQPWESRAAVFLKAADLITTKYRYDMLAYTMLSQGKNAYQAEIDATCELADFLRFNAKYAETIYEQQPLRNAPNVWNRAEYRALEGFVYAVTPFNFTAISGNLTAAPALMGNTVVWKPSVNAVLSNYKVYQIFKEAGLPDGVINFVPGDAAMVTERVLANKNFAALHFTGSTDVLQKLYQKIATNLPHYKSYPRIVGETGGKNFHFVHSSADIDHAVKSTVRGAFEYQGQKCSATSRAYIPTSIWPAFKQKLQKEISLITQGNSLLPNEFTSFMGPVIHSTSFNKVSTAITELKSDKDMELITGGNFNNDKGFYIEPTVFVTNNLQHQALEKEYFGPLLVISLYDEADLDKTLEIVDNTSPYGLTGSIFAQDRQVIDFLSKKLENAAGNFYINDKSTGAVVGQQWFGGARKSGTDDKAGSQHLLTRFVAVRNIKETMVPTTEVLYPSNY